ncbi:MAG: T9SS type A sorting domain-containing protein [Bacteroidetes bacterium]|nr:T9SS type A sorting domain-containing protein [Bacteroidota bacterium]
MRYVVTALVSFLLAGSGVAQEFQDLRDPETAEPIPVGFAVPPTDYERPDRSGGFELIPIQHVAEGSTKLVRTHPNGVLFQNGAYLISGEILHTNPDTAFVEEFDRVTLPAQPADLAIRDNLAFVALRKNRGLLILDITNPLDLQEVGALEGEDLLAIAVEGDFAYVGRGVDGIGVYDISDPSSPTLVHTSDTPGSANGIAVAGTTMYVADGNNANGPDFRIYDISTPESPTLLGEFEAGGFVTYVSVDQFSTSILYLSGDFGLKVLDVSNPALPVEIGSLSLGEETTYEVISGPSDDQVIFVVGLTGIYKVAVPEPSMPLLAQSFTDVEQGLSLAYHHGHNLALLADRFEGLGIHQARILGGNELPQIGFYENAGFSNKVFFDGDELYVTDLSGRLRILDVSDVFAGVQEIARIAVPPNTQEVHVESGVAYVTNSFLGVTRLTILDVADPTNPQIIGEWDNAHPAFGLDVVGSTLYLANGFSGLVALDVSNPANVQELGSFPMGSNTVDVVVDSARAVAYAVNFGTGMYSIDVSDPANMQELDAETDWGFLNAITFEPDFCCPSYGIVYVADASNGIRRVKVWDPTNIEHHYFEPVETEAKDVASVVGFYGDVFLSTGYAADDFFGLTSEKSFFESADRGIGITGTNGLLQQGRPALFALASGETGVYLFEGPLLASDEAPPAAAPIRLSSSHPNPASDGSTLRYTLSAAKLVRLEAYDLLGRRVATLVDGLQTAGPHEVTFYTNDLPSGVYILRLTARDQVATTKVSVIH